MWGAGTSAPSGQVADSFIAIGELSMPSALAGRLFVPWTVIRVRFTAQFYTHDKELALVFTCSFSYASFYTIAMTT